MGALFSCFMGQPRTKETSAPRTVSPPRPSGSRASGVYQACGADGYEFVQSDGSGAYRLLKNKRTSEIVMCKFVGTNSSNAFPRKIDREIMNHRSLNHPNIAKFYEVLVLLDSLGIVSEYPSGGCLSDRLDRDGPVTEAQAKTLFVQLLAGMQYCHEKSICHRDLRVQNMFLADRDGRPHLKISGFGYSKSTLWDGDPNAETMQKVRTEHAVYLDEPPELIEGVGDMDGSKLDIWGAGLSLFIMLTGRHPFDDVEETSPGTVRQDTNRIRNCSFTFPEEIELSRECKDFIGRIFVANPKDRPSIAELQKLPWLTGTEPPEEPQDSSAKPKASSQEDADIKSVVERAHQRKKQAAQQLMAQQQSQVRGAQATHMPTRVSIR